MAEASSAADACLRERLLVNAMAENVPRLLPPLTLRVTRPTRRAQDNRARAFRRAGGRLPLHQPLHDDQGRGKAPAGASCECANGAGWAPSATFFDLGSLSVDELARLLGLAARLKAELRAGLEHPYLRGRTLAMIFQKPSLRTRITPETGWRSLGGYAIYLPPRSRTWRARVGQAGRGAPRWVDLIMIRTVRPRSGAELVKPACRYQRLTDLLHPCQLLADLPEARERFGDLSSQRRLRRRRLLTSRKAGSRRVALRVSSCGLGCPQGYEPQRVRRADAPR